MAESGASSLISTLLVLVALLIGTNVAWAAGFLAVLGGASVASAIAGGGVAFAASVSLVLLVQSSLGLFSHAVDGTRRPRP